MVLQAEEECTCGDAEDVIRDNVAVLPWHLLDTV